MWRTDWLMSTTANWRSNHNHPQLLRPRDEQDVHKLRLTAGCRATVQAHKFRENWQESVKSGINAPLMDRWWLVALLLVPLAVWGFVNLCLWSLTNHKSYILKGGLCWQWAPLLKKYAMLEAKGGVNQVPERLFFCFPVENFNLPQERRVAQQVCVLHPEAQGKLAPNVQVSKMVLVLWYGLSIAVVIGVHATVSQSH